MLISAIKTSQIAENTADVLGYGPCICINSCRSSLPIYIAQSQLCHCAYVILHHFARLWSTVMCCYVTAGKSQRSRAVSLDSRSASTQAQGAPYHGQGVPPLMQGPPGFSIPSHAQSIAGLQGRAPVQAQLQVLRDSFNRVARPLCSDPSLPPTYPSQGPPPSSHYPHFSSFPSLLHTTPGGYPLESTAPHDLPSRVMSASNRSQDSGSIPRVGSAGNLQHHGLQQTSSLGRSSLPPSVAKYLAELEQHQAGQHSSSTAGIAGSRRQPPAAANRSFNASESCLLDQARQSQLPGSASGTSNPILLQLCTDWLQELTHSTVYTFPAGTAANPSVLQHIACLQLPLAPLCHRVYVVPVVDFVACLSHAHVTNAHAYSYFGTCTSDCDQAVLPP